MPSARKDPVVGIVGATGLVGRELVELIKRRRLRVGELKCFSSGRTRAFVSFHGRRLAAPEPSERALADCDLIFLVSSDEVARMYAPALAGRGVWVIDDSAAFRLDPKVPLVIPEVNADALRLDRRLIAGPNCTLTGLAVAGAALHRALGVREVRVASYQAVSGAGKAALGELFSQSRALARMGLRADDRAPILREGSCLVLPRAIAFNAVPQIGRFGSDGYSGEETKVAAELRKIWSAPNLKISVTAVRVPTIRAHALAAWLTLAQPLSPARARALMSKTRGLTLHASGSYPTPRSAGGKVGVFAGRLRQGTGPRELALWIVSDNLLKGAALNSVQIAEVLLKKGWLKPR